MSSVHRQEVIGYDDWAILTLPSSATKIIQMRRGGTISLGKFGVFKVDNIVGYAYGQSFEVLEDKEVQPMKSISYGMEDNSESREATPGLDFQSSEDNRDLLDRGSENQKITAEEIEKMKKEGSGNEVANKIIEKIIQGHGSFDKKTIYSQEKYLTRKQKKFTRRFTVNSLTTSNLLNHIRKDRDPERILGLSEETLGLIMSHANVMPGGNYLVMDETGGLIVYSMLERMQGNGSITLLHENDQPKLALFRHTNYTEEELSEMVKPISLLEFIDPKGSRSSFVPLPEEVVDGMSEMRKTRYLRRVKRVRQVNATLDMVEGNSFDGLVYVSTINPVTFVPDIIDRLKGSRSFSIYSQYKEVLLGLNHILLRDKRVLLPNIYESRVRKFQTIPGKVHPLMTSIGGGGYVMSGIKVFPKEGAVASGRRSKKRRAEEAEAAVKLQKVEGEEDGDENAKPQGEVEEDYTTSD
ncbi:DEKNAAC100185 [Brettanomyces naardenensis]|uniref:tRNA (adenine(58)-N(1))-methyltransferase non-catalytic subunit TRM6 n=1 Tax=Brettanomyces naardenensis TaxID=13370 RepID=A0A448YGH8_BRENA|nr:DEKNAAC100185 [Brettanomyces naardenensis]